MEKFNYLEGATPIDDASGLIPNGISTQSDLNRIEAENIFAAQKRYLRGKIDNPALWFNVETLTAIHRAMFGNVWTWAGTFRKTAIKPIGVEPYLIPVQLEELCREVRFWASEPIDLTFLEQAVRVHHRLVFIHPFKNGNGRFSRLIADRYLMAYGCPHPSWPYLQDPHDKVRSAYIQTLKAADGGDYDPLLCLIRTLGARDPFLSELLGLSRYKQQLSAEKRVAMVHALLRLKCEVNETHNNGHHPLHLAIKNGYQEIALVLVQHGADIKFKDKSGYDAFELAINAGMFAVANAICKAGYPYVPRMPAPSKIKYEMLYKFETEFLK
jgi:Fic-DOC domain mobile mystery protein B